jgi:LysR family hydrogen peroxide-inducible transcriptional activator
MNIRDLQYLVALSDHQHFGKAAAACFVSQPALSMQIKKLEADLGVLLLERHLKSVTLTTAGHAISEKARAILTQVSELRDMAQQAQDPFSGECHLGLFPTLAPYVLPHIIPAFNQAYPKLSLYLVEEKTAVLLEQLQHGRLNAILAALPIQAAGLSSLPLFDEEFLVAAPKTHAFSNQAHLETSQLQPHELLLLEEGHCLREQALSFCHSMQTSDHQRFQATSLETLRHMVMSGLGVTLMPKLACHANAHLSYIPFTHPKPKRTIGLVWRNSSQTPLLNSMADIIRQLNLGG